MQVGLKIIILLHLDYTNCVFVSLCFGQVVLVCLVS